MNNTHVKKNKMCNQMKEKYFMTAMCSLTNRKSESEICPCLGQGTSYF